MSDCPSLARVLNPPILLCCHCVQGIGHTGVELGPGNSSVYFPMLISEIRSDWGVENRVERLALLFGNAKLSFLTSGTMCVGNLKRRKIII